jgi:putative ABC transport system permease protein
MSLWSRIANVFCSDRLNREIDEELESHIQEAIENGRDPAEVRRAFGSTLRHREESRDVRLLTWLDSLQADAVFGLRQLKKNKIISGAAIVSLALAIGACTSAFRLIDALLLRPLPVLEPEGLYILSLHGAGFDGKPGIFDEYPYPLFRQLHGAVKDQAELLAVSFVERIDLTYGSDQEMEKAHVQYVSGSMFGSFGLRPVLGRLLTESDDLTPGAHPLAVLSHDYWTHRFGQDPKVIGRTFRLGNDLYQIVGVTDAPFTGTEPGTMTDIFAPVIMHPDADNSNYSWLRTWVRLKLGVAAEPVRQKLQATNRAFQEERGKGAGLKGIDQERFGNIINQAVVLQPAAAGVSEMQENSRPSLTVLGVVVALVLLIACANVANLMIAQGAARAREMGLRISIGAGGWRLVQLVLMESAWIAMLALALGSLFAWWAAPFVVSRINPPDNPARLFLPADWRVFVFALVLTLGVTFLFGLLPALRASAINPVSALKGGEDPHSRRHLMHALIALQVAFCFLVLFVASLFVATFERLSHRRTGFSAERLLTLDTVAQRPQPPPFWDQIADHLRTVPGVEKVAVTGWPLLVGYGFRAYITISGAPENGVYTYFLSVSPGWIDAMKIAFVDGRDFLASDTSPGVAIVNEAFAKAYFDGDNPVGKSFDKGHSRYRIVGLVRNAMYGRMREPLLPTAYVPFQSVDERMAWAPMAPRSRGTFIVRTYSPNPLTLAQTLRQEVPRARPEFRVSNIRTQLEINESQTVRERLLAMLALFFAVVALLLAGVGLYGVLHYSVLQRRHELGIRMAIGAQARDIARHVIADISSMVLLGAVAGLVLGMSSIRYVETLFYQVKATDLPMLGLPSLAIVAAALLASLPAVIQAVRIDPAEMLRAE